MTDEHPARVAGNASRAAASGKNKEAWLDLFAEDGWVEDPVGPSGFDPEGKGHHGREAISKFYDMTIATADKLEVSDRRFTGVRQRERQHRQDPDHHRRLDHRRRGRVRLSRERRRQDRVTSSILGSGPCDEDGTQSLRTHSTRAAPVIDRGRSRRIRISLSYLHREPRNGFLVPNVACR